MKNSDKSFVFFYGLLEFYLSDIFDTTKSEATMLNSLPEALTADPAYQKWLGLKGADFMEEVTNPIHLGVSPDTNETQYLINAAYDSRYKAWWTSELTAPERILFLAIYARRVAELA